MQQKLRSVVALSTMALLSACADSPTSIGDLTANPRGGTKGGAILTASKTANGFFEQRIEYDWTLDKKVKDILDGNMLAEPSTSETTIKPGQVKWVHYEFTGTRKLASRQTVKGARGEVCVRNSGDVPTQGLRIQDVVQYKSGSDWVDVSSSLVSTTENPQLDPGERHCYPYEASFDVTDGKTYRNAAVVTVTNHAGHSSPSGETTTGGTDDERDDDGNDGDDDGDDDRDDDGNDDGDDDDDSDDDGRPRHGLTVYAPFQVPTSPVIMTVDATAIVYDDMRPACAKVFPALICTGSEGFHPVTLTETTTFIGAATIDFYNYVVCGQEFVVTNHAKIVESGPTAPGKQPDTDHASASIRIKTGDCPPKPVNAGCTLTQGYWKNHAWPKHPMWAPSTLATWPDINDWKFFDTTYEWPEVLNVPPRGDAYFILAHQYIAASLNQQNGAYVPEEVRAALVASYDYFSMKAAERAAFDRNRVIALATPLDRYNNGQLGVPHCD